MPLRYLLSLKIDDTAGDDDMGDMERAMENANIQYWEKPGDYVEWESLTDLYEI
mgnify:FL=1